MRKGIVVKVNKGTYVVLRDGRYISLKGGEGKMIGEEVDDWSETRKKRWSFQPAYKVVAATCLAFILSFTTFTQSISNAAYVYMTIDLNPSFELTIDEEMKVINVLPLNKEGESLIHDVRKWRGQSLKTVTMAIIGLCEQKGYLAENGEVLMSTTVDEHVKEEDLAKTEKQLEQFALEMEKEDFTLVHVKATPAVREKARKKGVSTGEYVVEQYADEVEIAKKDPGARQEKVHVKEQETTVELSPKKEETVTIRIEKEPSPPKKNKQGGKGIKSAPPSELKPNSSSPQSEPKVEPEPSPTPEPGPQPQQKENPASELKREKEAVPQPSLQKSEKQEPLKGNVSTSDEPKPLAFSPSEPIEVDAPAP